MVAGTFPRLSAFASLVAAAGFVWAPLLARARHPVASAYTAPAMPAQVGAWKGRSLAVDARAIEILETENVSLMEYKRDGQQPIWLSYVSGFGNRAAFHPPEICYVGSHYEVLERGPITLSIGGKSRRLMRLLIAQEGQRYEAWYWFTAGPRVTWNYYQQQAWLLRDLIQSRHSSGTLVRISTPQEDPQASHARLLDFMSCWETATIGSGDG